MIPDVAAVRSVATEAREYLLGRFSEWKRERRYAIDEANPPSKDMCRGAACALALILEAELGGAWCVVGGWERRAEPTHVWDEYVDLRAVPGGMLDADGRWRGHYWVASQPDPEDPEAPRLYVDVTADQFGHEGVVVAREDDPRYRANLWEMTIEEELGAGAMHWGHVWSADFFAERDDATVDGAEPIAVSGMAA